MAAWSPVGERIAYSADYQGDELKGIDAEVQYLHIIDWNDQDRIVIFGASFATISASSPLVGFGVDSRDEFCSLAFFGVVVVLGKPPDF